jgi:hypothetical protein
MGLVALQFRNEHEVRAGRDRDEFDKGCGSASAQ